MEHLTKRQRLAAMWGAFVVSTFIAIEMAAILIGGIYAMIDNGIAAYISYGLSFALILTFFIWFYRRAYQVEIELFADPEKDSYVKENDS